MKMKLSVKECYLINQIRAVADGIKRMAEADIDFRESIVLMCGEIIDNADALMEDLKNR